MSKSENTTSFDKDEKERRAVVLIFTKHYLPGFKGGGPIKSISNLVDALGDKFEFYIVTQDRDIGDSAAYAFIDQPVWNIVGKAKVRYISKSSSSFANPLNFVKTVRPDFVYLNSVFDRLFTLPILIGFRLGLLSQTPIILAPRGELSKGALELKRRRKFAYLRLLMVLGVFSGVRWHASSVFEQDDILHSPLTPPLERIHVAIDLASRELDPRMPRSLNDDNSTVRICFLSRISPMKNLDFAIRILAKVKTPVSFSIYGPIEDRDYWVSCMGLLDALPNNISATYLGEIAPQDVVRTMGAHDLFLFPTRGENYGHVIFEALVAGLPVLTSDQTPWNELEQNGAGWCFSLNHPKAFSEKIEELASWSSETRLAASSRAALYGSFILDSNEAVIANQALFSESIDSKELYQ